jgi:signal transduction histidine kinase
MPPSDHSSSDPGPLPFSGICPICDHGTTLLAHIDTPVFVVSPTGSFLFVNDACLRLIGSPSREESMKFNAFKLPAMQAVGLDRLLRRCLGGERIDQDVDYISMWGKPAQVRLEALPLRDAEGRVTAAACVLEEHQRVREQQERIESLSAELRETRHQLRELDDLRSRLVAKVSHELRTPLLPLQGYLQMLEEEKLGALNDPQRKAIRVARRNADRLIELVEQTLEAGSDRSLRRPRRRQTVEPAVLIQDALEAMAPVFDRRGVPVEADVAQPLPRVSGDRPQLTRVLMTLLDNAQKYVDDEGRIQVRARAEAASRVSIEVSNTGQQIPRNQREQVFEPFYQVDPTDLASADGRGLGLSIARDVVEAHDGDIAVTEREGFATTVRLTLPGLDESREAGLSHPAQLRILLKGATTGPRSSLGRALSDAGYDVRPMSADASLGRWMAAWPPDALVFAFSAMDAAPPGRTTEEPCLGPESGAAVQELLALWQTEGVRVPPVFAVFPDLPTPDEVRRLTDAGFTAVVGGDDASSELVRLLEAVERQPA